MKKIFRFKTEEEWIKVFVDHVMVSAMRAVSDHGVFRMGLSGGETPKPLYQALALVKNFPWSRTELSLVDERDVPHDDPRSNYRMVREELMGQLSSLKNIFSRVNGDKLAQHFVASLRDATKCLRSASPKNSRKDIFQRFRNFFDLLLLGIGSDGHTASLFPNSPALQVEDQWVVKTEPAGKPFVSRYTLTYPALMSAREIIFLLRGKEKEAILKKVQVADPSDPSCPAARIFHLPQARVFYLKK